MIANPIERSALPNERVDQTGPESNMLHQAR